MCLVVLDLPRSPTNCHIESYESSSLNLVPPTELSFIIDKWKPIRFLGALQLQRAEADGEVLVARYVYRADISSLGVFGCERKSSCLSERERTQRVVGETMVGLTCSFSFDLDHV